MNICWIDIETTGLDTEKCAPISIALVLDSVSAAGEHSLIDKAEFKMRPFPGARIEDSAFAVNGFTLEEIATFPSENETLVEIIKFLRSGRGAPFVIGGHNVMSFDIPFLRNLFERIFSYYEPMWNGIFNDDIIDSKLIADDFKYDGIIEKTNLVYLRGFFGIETGTAHTAMSDALASREVYLKLNEYRNDRRGA